ncbi:MAG TPA: AAA family ATPase [Firmicutes bacterium]|nr:AAA family ATPase [Bacillota bacterium]
MTYEEFYGLSEQPFSNAVDEKFYFKSHQHEQATIRMLHAIDTMKGLAVMIGESGIGKSLLARRIVIEQLDDSDKYEAGLLIVVHTDITPDWLLKKIALQMGVETPSEDKLQIIKQLFERLLQIHEEGRKAVLLIDEANMLKKKEIMEELRGLLNLEVPGKKLLTIVLIGIPELEDNLKSDPALAQRVALKFVLGAMKQEEVQKYITHRLTVAGCSKEIFSKDAYQAIYTHSTGIPRIINTLCDNCLLEGFLLKKETIDAQLVEDVAMGLGV